MAVLQALFLIRHLIRKETGSTPVTWYKNMADSLSKEEIEIYSEKYDIHAVIKDYSHGIVTKLFFEYEGKSVVLGIRLNHLNKEEPAVIGLNILESYIENLATTEGRKLKLHYWYIEEIEQDGEKYMIGHGIVTGHKKIQDSTDIHTSSLNSFYIDEAEKEMVLITRNSKYHCPLEYCKFRKQDEFPDVIPDYEELKVKYKDAINYPEIEPGKVLLVLANFCNYYYHSAYFVPEESSDKLSVDFDSFPHVGMFQDSYLIKSKDGSVDLRYFPHYQNIEFYSELTGKAPLFLENIGDVVIFARTHCGLIKLLPGERKEVKKDNSLER